MASCRASGGAGSQGPRPPASVPELLLAARNRRAVRPGSPKKASVVLRHVLAMLPVEVAWTWVRHDQAAAGPPAAWPRARWVSLSQIPDLFHSGYRKVRRSELRWAHRVASDRVARVR